MSDLPAPPSFKSTIIQIKPVSSAKPQNSTHPDYTNTNNFNNKSSKASKAKMKATKKNDNGAEVTRKKTANASSKAGSPRMPKRGKKHLNDEASQDDEYEENACSNSRVPSKLANKKQKINSEVVTSPSDSLKSQSKKDHKTAHSIIEKKRRIKLNREFEALKILVPACRNSIINTNGNTSSAAVNDSMYKLTILQATVEYINYLHKIIRLLHNSQASVVNSQASGYQEENLLFSKLSLNLENYRNLDLDFDFMQIMNIFKLMSNFGRLDKNKSKNRESGDGFANDDIGNNNYLVGGHHFDSYLLTKGISQEHIEKFHLFFGIEEIRQLNSAEHQPSPDYNQPYQSLDHRGINNSKDQNFSKGTHKNHAFKNSVFNTLNRQNSIDSPERRSFTMPNMPSLMPNMKYPSLAGGTISSLALQRYSNNHTNNSTSDDKERGFSNTMPAMGGNGNWKRYSPQISPVTKYLSMSPNANGYHFSKTTSSGPSAPLYNLSVMPNKEFQLPSPLMDLPNSNTAANERTRASNCKTSSTASQSTSTLQHNKAAGSSKSRSSFSNTAINKAVGSKGNNPFKRNLAGFSFSSPVFSKGYMPFKNNAELFSLPLESITNFLQTSKMDTNSKALNSLDSMQSNESKEAGEALLQMKRNSVDTSRSNSAATSPLIDAIIGSLPQSKEKLSIKAGFESQTLKMNRVNDSKGMSISMSNEREGSEKEKKIISRVTSILN